MYINFIIFRLLLPFLCTTVYYADAQGFHTLPTGSTTLTGTYVSSDGNEIEVDLLMQGATTTRANQTVCTGFNLVANDLFFIFQFQGHADYSNVHHMGLYACSSVPENNPCRCAMTQRSPLFTWARNTPQVRFTGNDEGYFGFFRVGAGTDRNFIFLETHYFNRQTTPDTTSGIKIRFTRNLNTEPPGGSYELAIYSVMGTGTIPANTPSYTINACVRPSALPSFWSNRPYVIGFQSHTHNLGRAVITYNYAETVLDGSPQFITNELGVGNPLWPNAYVFKKDQTPTDSLYSLFLRCIYTSTGVNNNTNTNGKFDTPTAWAEMCVQSLILAIPSGVGKWPATTPAYLTGTCSSYELSVMNNMMPPAFPTVSDATNSVLNAYATSGTGSGSYDYTTAAGQNYNIDLSLQNFGNFFTT